MEEPVVIRADRLQAAVRAGWRGMGAAIVFGALRLLYRECHWELIRRTDLASFLALAGLAAVLAVIGLIIAYSAMSWMALALWPGFAGATGSAIGICLRFGPFGSADLAWGDLAIEAGDEDDVVIDAELVTPRIRHVDVAGDISDQISRYCAVTPVQWRQLVSRRPQSHSAAKPRSD